MYTVPRSEHINRVRASKKPDQQNQILMKNEELRRKNQKKHSENLWRINKHDRWNW